jgi:uncharacterized protein with HEPN domain
MIQYADEIALTIERYNLDFEKFKEDFVVKNAIAMCILQIGELVGKLSDDFKKRHSTMPWKEIKAMRNVAAHNYGEIDLEILWETVINDVPALKDFCRRKDNVYKFFDDIFSIVVLIINSRRGLNVGYICF